MQKIISRMRKIDEIGWYDPRRIGIILPYTSERGAQRFAENLCQLMDPYRRTVSLTYIPMSLIKPILTNSIRSLLEGVFNDAGTHGTGEKLFRK